MNSIWFGLLVATFAGLVQSHGVVKVEKSDEHSSLENIAWEICTNKNSVAIKHPSTIKQVSEYLAENSKRVPCDEQDLDNLHALVEVVESHPHNLCDDAKMSLVEDFAANKLSSSAGVLATFFQNYQAQLNDACNGDKTARIALESDRLFQ